MPTPLLGQEVMVGKLPTRFEVPAAEVDGAYSLVRQVIPAGVLMLPHTHRNEDQVAVVLCGELGVLVGDREWTAKVGEVVVRPRGEVHAVWNATDDDIEILEITSPGRFEHYFMTLGELTVRQALNEAPRLAAEWQIEQVPETASRLADTYGVAL